MSPMIQLRSVDQFPSLHCDRNVGSRRTLLSIPTYFTRNCSGIRGVHFRNESDGRIVNDSTTAGI